MLTKKYRIIEVFTREPWKALTFKQVKNLSKNKSDHYVHKSLKDLVKDDILKEERVGNNILYSVKNSVHSLNTIGYITEYRTNTAKYLPDKNLKKLIKKLKTSFYSFIITGSYAKKQQKEDSDMDIVIICDDAQKPGKVLAQIRLASELMMPEVHPYIFRESEFYEMLTNKEENYGKEIAKNNLILTGAKQYYTILMKAIENGFKG